MASSDESPSDTAEPHAMAPEETLSSDHSDDPLDEEDLELLEENTGRKFRTTRTFKRLKKGRIGDDSDESEQEPVVRAKTAPRDLETLFEDDEGTDAIRHRPGSAGDSGLEESQDDGEDDELADFIEDDDVDDEAEIEKRASRLNKNRASDASRKGRPKSAYLSEGQASLHDAWREMAEIFGEGFDYDPDDEPADDSPQKSVSIHEAFEPAELVERLFTDEDEAIRVLDVPERIQLRDGSSRPPISDTDLRLESVWIAFKIENLSSRPESEDFRRNFLNAIAAVVKFIREDYFEVPFIATHRKEYFIDHLTLEDLWAVYDYDGRWKVLQERKARLTSSLNLLLSREKIDESHLVHLLGKSELDEEDLDDCFEYVQSKHAVHLASLSQDGSSPGGHRSSGSVFKRPVRGSSIQLHNSVSSSGLLAGFLDKFGITFKQLGINICDQMKRFEPEDAAMSPETIAESFVSPSSPGLANTDAVLDTAARELAKELALEPMVRKAFRAMAEGNVFVSALPTEKGIHEITHLHEFAHFKYLSRKPMGAFVRDEYLELAEASASSLLTVQIDVGPDERSRAQTEALVVSELHSEAAARWNPFRKRVLGICIDSYITPYLQKKMSERMKSQAMRWVGSFCQNSLTDKLLSGRYSRRASSLKEAGAGYVGSSGWEKQPREESEHVDEKALSSRIYMAVSWGNGALGSPAFAVCVDGQGCLVDHLGLASLTDGTRRAGDLVSLFEFVVKMRPYVIGVCGTSISSKSLMFDVQKMLEEHASSHALAAELRDIEVVWVDDDSARVFQNSAMAREEFPAFPSLFSYTVSLARRLVDPLCEISRLSNVCNDILQLPLHPHQGLLSDLHKYLERALVNVTNLIGVDLNRAIRHPFARSLLPFVCGLGVRKSQALLKSISRNCAAGHVERRTELLRRGILGRRVFLNAASFLRIDPAYLPRKNQYEVDVLDCTRIHPESYDLARKMAADALETEEARDDDQNPSLHVEELMRRPEKLNDLMLEEYAKELERAQRVPKLTTLKDIRAELQAPFKDRRRFVPLEPDRLFEILTGESDKTLFPGQMVSVDLFKIGERFATGRLVESGIPGSISVRNMSDQYVSDPASVFRPRQIVVCKVLAVNKERCSVDLSCKPSDLESRSTSRPNDQHYDYERERQDTGPTLRPSASSSLPTLISTAAYRASVSSRPGSRNISHPLFKNLNRAKAEALLAESSPGEVIIRPSSKGLNNIAVSWRVTNGVYHHIDIREEAKDAPWALGKVLIINGEKYDDLDEVVARYVDPMMSYCNDIMAHPKYFSISSAALSGPALKRQVENTLHAMKAEQPKRIVYLLSLVPEQPTRYLLSYLPFERTYHEMVSVTPSGFRFRGNAYSSVEGLLNAFKREHMSRQAERAG